MKKIFWKIVLFVFLFSMSLYGASPQDITLEKGETKEYEVKAENNEKNPAVYAKDLILKENSTLKVNGNITAETVVIDGEVSGEVAADKVEIGNTGKVYATITSAVFVIQEGGVFEGRKKMKIALIKEEQPKSKTEKDNDLKPKENTVKEDKKES